jgi:hypothetical protein
MDWLFWFIEYGPPLILIFQQYSQDCFAISEIHQAPIFGWSDFFDLRFEFSTISAIVDVQSNPSSLFTKGLGQTLRHGAPTVVGLNRPRTFAVFDGRYR